MQLKTVDLRGNRLVSVPHFLFEVDCLERLEVSWGLSILCSRILGPILNLIYSNIPDLLKSV